jgi:hypothetical protein
METSAEIQSIIRQQFQNLHTKEDLLCLLNVVKDHVYGKKTKPFYLNQLTFYYGSKKHIVKYNEFTIRKKSGKERVIHAPVRGLKAIQRTLAYILEAVHEPHEAAFGFRKASSIVDNATKHVGSRYIYNIDLKDFFPSVDQARIWKCLQLKPFVVGKKEKGTQKNKQVPELLIMNNMEGDSLAPIQAISITIKYDGMKLLNGKWETTNTSGEKISYSVYVNYKKRNAGYIDFSFTDFLTEIITGEKKITLKDIESSIEAICNQQERLMQEIPSHTPASIIAALCCMNMEVERKNEGGEWEKVMRNVLPQGAPTSPVITNIICKRLDILLSGLAKRFRLKYSRYADDITFSSEHNVYQHDGEFVKELKRIINNQGFEIKDSKTRLQKAEHRQEVTGLLVNKKINVQKRYIKQLRTWIHILEKNPYGKANRIIVEQYMNDKGNVKKETVKIENLLRGKLAYLAMIKGKNCSQYITLKTRLENALDSKKFINRQREHFSTVSKRNENMYPLTQNDIIYDPESLVDEIIEKGLDNAMDETKIDF